MPTPGSADFTPARPATERATRTLGCRHWACSATTPCCASVGKRSERYSVDGEEPLFAGLENPEAPPPPHVDEAPDAEEPDDEPRGRGAKERRRRGASRIPADIRRVVEVIEPTPEELRCPCCDDHRERHVIGYEETERLE
ncbi:MAG: hypothetical protein IPM29_32890 [Planctomycetes bacterium]|nr:hypothetical protein [Planctomycetota bacterium]